MELDRKQAIVLFIRLLEARLIGGSTGIGRDGKIVLSAR